MLIVALVLAVIGLAALVTAVVTSNEIVAWVCIGASALGVVLLVVDAIRERQHRRLGAAAAAEIATEATELDELRAGGDTTEFVTYSDDEPADERVESEQQAGIDAEAETEADAEIGARAAGEDLGADVAAEIAVEDHPDEVIHDEPEYDTYSDDEQEFPESAEEAALHPVDEAAVDGTEPDGTEPDAADSGRR